MRMNRREFLALGAGALASFGARPDDGIVVHEWGVVTVPYGHPQGGVRSAGVRKGKNGEEISDLPEFVTTWTKAVGDDIQRLERMPVRKPVLNFYTGKEQTVRVRVSIPSGRPDAWWPPAASFGPTSKFVRAKQLGGEPLRIDQIDPVDGHLEWNAVRVIPEDAVFREAAGWWSTARKTDAAMVRSGGETERFLFYDALAAFDPGLEIRWKKGGKVTIANRGEEAIHPLFAIQVRDGRCRSAVVKELRGGASVELTLEPEKPALSEALVGAGLYKKEADGIAEIWDEEFLGMDGARVISFVPRAAFDRLLPLEIQPVPKDLKRVLLAHVECLDAEGWEEVEALIAQLEADDPQVRDMATMKLRAKMPLAAAVVRARLATAGDAEVRGRLEDLLKPKRG